MSGLSSPTCSTWGCKGGGGSRGGAHCRHWGSCSSRGLCLGEALHHSCGSSPVLGTDLGCDLWKFIYFYLCHSAFPCDAEQSLLSVLITVLITRSLRRSWAFATILLSRGVQLSSSSLLTYGCVRPACCHQMLAMLSSKHKSDRGLHQFFFS